MTRDTWFVQRDAITRLLVLFWLTGSIANAQANNSTIERRATRAELAEKAARLEDTTAKRSQNAEEKSASIMRLEALRKRLAEGDFRVGDRFLLTITMDSSKTDTVSVRDGVLVSVASLPDLSLKGLILAELDDAIAAHVSRFYKNVRIRTVPLTQVSVIGAVARPGFYWASPERPIAEIIMMAGGPLPDANLRELEIRRANRVVLKPKESRSALVQGRTMEQVDVRSGDEVKIPLKRKVNWASMIQLLFVVSSLFFAFIQFIQWYYGRQE